MVNLPTLLLWLYPQFWVGPVEATAEPSIGCHFNAALHGTTFGVAAGTGYQAVRAGFIIPADEAGYGGAVEAEHLWKRGEHVTLRTHVNLSPSLYLTYERTLGHRVHWDVGDKETGRRLVSLTQRQSVYLTMATERFIIRAGGAQGEGALTLTARW